MAKEKAKEKEKPKAEEKIKSLSSGISVGGGNNAIILSFQGGIGKHIVATSFVRWINEKFPNKKIMQIISFLFILFFYLLPYLTLRSM